MKKMYFGGGFCIFRWHRFWHSLHGLGGVRGPPPGGGDGIESIFYFYTNKNPLLVSHC